MLMGFGIDPIKFLQSPQGAALLAPVRQDIGNSFDQSRMNLVDMMGGSGFSPGSGMSAGPMANMFSSEAGAQSNATQQLIAQALGLGVQGGNILNGQQAIFDPSRNYQNSINAGQTVIQAPSGPGWGLASAALGAAGTAAGGLLGKPPCFVAAELYGGWDAPRTVGIRKWLTESRSLLVRTFLVVYGNIGYEWSLAIRKSRWLRKATKMLFDSFPGS